MNELNESGYWEWYYNNGNLSTKGNYTDGKRTGYWEMYYLNGEIMLKEYYI